MEGNRKEKQTGAQRAGAHRRAVLEAQKILKAAAKQAEGAGYTLAALLERAGVSRQNWKNWLAGFCLPRPSSLEAVKQAAAEMAGRAAVGTTSAGTLDKCSVCVNAKTCDREERDSATFCEAFQRWLAAK